MTACIPSSEYTAVLVVTVTLEHKGGDAKRMKMG